MKVETIAQLEALYGAPVEASLRKVCDRLTESYRAWIERSRFCVLSTVGPEGTDTSPRGNDGPVLRVLDERTLALPDWRGNKRLDSLRNIVRDGRVSLMFFVAGSNTVVRVNGRAHVTTEPQLVTSFEQSGTNPKTVTVIEISEVYFQCARALIRAGLWSGGDQSAGLPTPGDMLNDTSGGEIGGAAYDEAWESRAARTMW